MADDAWQSAWVEVVPDFSDFRKNANKQMTSILSGAGDDAGKAGSKAAGASFVGGIKGWGAGILGAVAALGIGKMVGNFLFDSISLGSDLNESTNAIKVAYGAAFGDIAKLGDGSAKRLGLSEIDFNSIATQFSAFARTISSSDPSKFIDELSTRGADFASVFNIDVAEALRLFQSGLAGETEPLRRYGLDLSEAAVTAFAYANGIGVAGKALTESQKQQARYGALLAQTNMVQGDFRNTSDGLANAQRIFQASLDDTKAKLGEALLPAMAGVVAYGNESFIPFFDDLVTKLTTKVGPDLGAFIEEQDPEKNQVRIDAFMADLGRRLGLGWDQISVFFGNEFVNANKVMGEKLQLGWTQIADFFTRQLGDSLNVWGGKFQNGLSQIGSFISSSIAQWGASFNNGAAQIGSFFSGLSVTISSWVAGLVGDGFNAGASIVRGIASGIGSAIGSVSSAIGDVMSTIASYLPHSPADRGEFSGAGWAAVQASGKALMGQFVSGMDIEASAAASMNALAASALAPRAMVGSISTRGLEGSSAAASAGPSQLTVQVLPERGKSAWQQGLDAARGARAGFGGV